MNAQLRGIFPKHAVLNECTQKELYEAASMMDSRALNSIDGKTPCELFCAIFGEAAENGESYPTIRAKSRVQSDKPHSVGRFRRARKGPFGPKSRPFVAQTQQKNAGNRRLVRQNPVSLDGTAFSMSVHHIGANDT